MNVNRVFFGLYHMIRNPYHVLYGHQSGFGFLSLRGSQETFDPGSQKWFCDSILVLALRL